jgi:DNA-binding NarL/FixJ family response regulator
MERRLQQVEALELRARGGSLAAIAEHLGVSLSTAQRRLTAALRDLGAETSDELRRTAETRFSDILSRAYALLDVLPPEHHPRVLSLIRATTADLVRLWGVAVPPMIVLRSEGLDV